MHHALCNSGIKQWVSDWIRDLGRYNQIDMISITDPVLLLQKDKEVNVRQPPLLELYSEDIALDISKQPILDIFEH